MVNWTRGLIRADSIVTLASDSGSWFPPPPSGVHLGGEPVNDHAQCEHTQGEPQAKEVGEAVSARSKNHEIDLMAERRGEAHGCGKDYDNGPSN